MKLTKHAFGRTGDRVSELCLSTSNFSRYASHEESFAILDAFREAGGNFIQTSGICPGLNLGDGFLGVPEELLGRWLKQRRVDRRSLVIATRIAFTRPVVGGLDSYVQLVRRSAQDSIRRIGCGELDYLVVEWTEAVAPVAESMVAFQAAIAAGEVRHIVPANFPIPRVLEGFATLPADPPAIAGLQVDYSLAAPYSLEGGAGRFCADHGLGAIGRSPLAGGHLVGRGPAARTGAPDAIPLGTIEAAERVRGSLVTWARKRGHSPAQVALAWGLSHPQITSMLVSVTTANQLRELLAATRIAFSGEERQRLAHPGRTRAEGREPNIPAAAELTLTGVPG